MNLILMISLVILIVVLIGSLITSAVRVVPQAHSYIIERLGAYQDTWPVGLHFKIPIIDRIANKVDLKEQVADFPPQPVITKDNVTMSIDTVIYYRITDPKLYTYGVKNPLNAIENLTATTLRNVIGEMDLDTTLTSRDIINSKMRVTLDEATDPWGIKVSRVELKNIMPPRTIQESMEKQMKAERERREKILRAEGEKESTVLVAQGRNEAMILDAKAKKEAAIQEALGKAEAIKSLQQAEAEGLRYLKDAGVDEAVLQLKAIEAFSKAADGKATKIIIPSEIQSMVGLVKSLQEGVQDPQSETKPVSPSRNVKPPKPAA